MNNHQAKSHFLKKVLNDPQKLIWYYILVNLAPSLYFALNQPSDLIGKIIAFLFPLGTYLLIFSFVKKIGKWYILLLLLIILNGFQIVLFYLFGEADPIASDMFLNLVTTSQSETGELLGSLSLAIATVCILYIPPIILAVREWIRQDVLPKNFRRKLFYPALVCIGLSFVLSFFSRNENGSKLTFKNDVYPVNVFYNLGFALNKMYKIYKYPETSKNFSFHATRVSTHPQRLIVVLVIGETSRADNWELFGYHRATNPNLEKLHNLILFKNAITQNNATHKSVPIILSSNDADNFKQIYYRKGIFEAFNEVGFKTICISNQTLNGSFIQYFYEEADSFKEIRTTHPEVNPDDIELTNLMNGILKKDTGNLFIVLHSYGSHFKYTDRYPKAFRKFIPDKIKRITLSEKQNMINAYDNSILYTDYFLSKTIQDLKKTKTPVLLLYTSDHGEDLMDDKRRKFLHASPYPTYYQLHIPFFIWFSDAYREDYPERISAAMQNSSKPISTNSVFHTLLDAASIQSPYLNKSLSLVDTDFKIRPRMYLNDHDEAIPYQEMNLGKVDFLMIKKHNLGK